MRGLRPYPTYRESGVDWLGDVPETWGVSRIKRISRIDPSKTEVSGLFGPDTRVVFLPMQAVGTDGRFNEAERRELRDVWDGFTYFHRGDVLVAKITPCFENGKGACLSGLATDLGFGSTEFTVLRPRAGVTAGFLYRITTLPEFRARGADSMTGAAGQQRVPPRFVGNFIAPVAPVEDQVAITRYLDHMDRRIRRYIRAKRRLISLLEEQKRAIFQRAVTRGLDPDVRLKPSGVEWLGEVPEHWDVVPFVRCTIERADYRGATPEKVDSGVFLVTAKNVRRGWIDYDASQEFVRSDQYAAIMRRGLPRKGDILLTTEAPLGHVALVDREDVAFAQRIIRFRMDDTIAPGFVLLSMLSPYFRNQLAARATGSTAEGIKASKLPQLQILRPPRDEQEAILSRMDSEVAKLDASIGAAQRQVALAREYRTRLIADVVTGKLDVREAAARLSDGPAELGPDGGDVWPGDDEPIDAPEADDEERTAEPEEIGA